MSRYYHKKFVCSDLKVRRIFFPQKETLFNSSVDALKIVNLQKMHFDP